MVRRVLYGYRDDLNLGERWWHRPFFVLLDRYCDDRLDLRRRRAHAAKTVKVRDTHVDAMRLNARPALPILQSSVYVDGYDFTAECSTPTEPEKQIFFSTPGANKSFCTKREFAQPAVVKQFNTTARTKTSPSWGRVTRDHGGPKSMSSHPPRFLYGRSAGWVSDRRKRTVRRCEPR